MARATLGEWSVVNWGEFVADYDRIRDAIEEVFPIFEKYNARIRVPGGFHLVSTARQRIWATPTGKANFLVFGGLGEDPGDKDPDTLWLGTIRSHDQYNTTLYSPSADIAASMASVTSCSSTSPKWTNAVCRTAIRSIWLRYRPMASNARCGTSGSLAIRPRMAAARSTIRRPTRWFRLTRMTS